MNGILARLAGLSFRGLLIVAGLILGIYYAAFFDDGSSIDKTIADIQGQIGPAEAQAAEAEKALQEVEQVRAQVGTLGDQYRLVAQKLPTEVQMSEMIRVIDQLAKASGVSIKSKEPQQTSDRQYYEEIPVKIALEGNYSEITTFLFKVSSFERIMRLKNFVISNRMGPSSGAGDFNGQLTFEGQILSYRFKGDQSKKGAPQ